MEAGSLLLCRISAWRRVEGVLAAQSPARTRQRSGVLLNTACADFCCIVEFRTLRVRIEIVVRQRICRRVEIGILGEELIPAVWSRIGRAIAISQAACSHFPLAILK